MANKVLNFEIEKYDLVEMADSDIMTVKLQIVSEGNNRHNLPIPWSAIEKAMPTLVGKPIVAKYNRWTKDLMGHEVDEVPIGVILTPESIFVEEIDGKRWLCAIGNIWMGYSQEVTGVLIRDMLKGLSMEIYVVEQDETDESILAFVFKGITLIGSDRNPAVPNAKVEVLTFEVVKDEIEKRVSFDADSKILSDDFVDRIADKLYKKFQEKDGERMEEKMEEMECGEKKMEEEVEVEAVEEKMTADANVEAVAQEKMQEDVAEEQREIAKEENAPAMMEVEVAKYEELEEKVKEFSALEEKIVNLEGELKTYSDELESLREFKANYDTSLFEAEVESTFAEVVDDMPKEEVEKFRAEAKNYTIENIQDWKNQVHAKAYTYTKGGKSEKKHIRIDIPTETKQKSNGLWD
jgi:hypothetical protein